MRRTSRWATTASSVAVIRKGSRPRSTSRVIALGASFVCTVANTVCPVRLASTATWAVSRVADLPHQDHVRILAQHGAQDARVGDADVLVDRHLDDALDVVLDRVLDGDDLDRPRRWPVESIA